MVTTLEAISNELVKAYNHLDMFAEPSLGEIKGYSRIAISTPDTFSFQVRFSTFYINIYENLRYRAEEEPEVFVKNFNGIIFKIGRLGQIQPQFTDAELHETTKKVYDCIIQNLKLDPEIIAIIGPFKETD